MENTTTPPTPTSPATTLAAPLVTPRPKKVYWLIALVVLTLLAVVGGYALGYTTRQNNSNLPVQDNDDNEEPNDSEGEAPEEPVRTEKTYTYMGFSFKYLSDWKVADINSDPDFFTKNALDRFEHEIKVSKGDYILYIGIDREPSEETSEGIFINSSDLEEFKKTRDSLRIEDGQFYFNKSHVSLQEYRSGSAGILGYADLSEYIEDMTAGYDGYQDFIKDKNGYSYLIVKFDSQAQTGDLTPAEIQQEMIDILESINW